MKPLKETNVYSYLNYSDVPKAMEWLEQAFGFQPLRIEEIGNGRQHGEMWIGKEVIMMATANPNLGMKLPAETEEAFGVFIYVDDIEAHYKKSCDFGVNVVNKLEQKSYGYRYIAKDIDHHNWVFVKNPN